MALNSFKLALTASAAMLIASCDKPIDPKAEQALIERSEALANQFQSELKKELGTALGKAGPIGAVGVCQSAAPAIAQRLSEENGAIVRRIARKNRNPNGALSSDLEPLYSQLEASPMDEGKPRVVHGVKDGRFTYMRAIPMKEQPCTVCHGSEIDPDLETAINAAYPQDRAKGFQPGELRGAFVIEIASRSEV